MAHKDEIMEYIEKYGSITDKQAEDDIGCRRLSARINDLRNEGKKIKTDMIPVKNRHNKTVYIARYSKVV